MLSTYMSLKITNLNQNIQNRNWLIFRFVFILSKIVLNFLIKKSENYISYKYTIQYLFII